MAVSSPLHRLEARYGELLALCDAVESIMDSLGGLHGSEPLPSDRGKDPDIESWTTVG